ncbi:MAG: putative N-acetyltransferase YhbS [Ascidiaceihabitans sp.]|jgi:predicted N-acetyltransferase YhbS
METEVHIRLAQQKDAEGIAFVIQTALRESTSKDYVPAIISLTQKRIVFVAFHEQRVVGTATLSIRS